MAPNQQADPITVQRRQLGLPRVTNQCGMGLLSLKRILVSQFKVQSSKFLFALRLSGWHTYYASECKMTLLINKTSQFQDPFPSIETTFSLLCLRESSDGERELRAKLEEVGPGKVRGPTRASRRTRFPDFCDFPPRDSDFSRDFLADLSNAHAQKVYCACSDKKGCFSRDFVSFFPDFS